MSCELKKDELDPKLREELLYWLSQDGLIPKTDEQIIEWVNNSPYRTLLNRPLHEFHNTETDTGTDGRSDIIEIEVR